MKKLFEGKRKLISIPLLGILSLVFFPIAIGLGLGFLVYKKVSSPKLKYSILAVVTLFTLFSGSAWVVAITSSSKPKQEQEQAVVQTTPTPETSVLAEEVTQEPSPTPTLKPTSTPTATPTINPNFQIVKVTRVVDGDTIEIEGGKKVRYIGIDTPETVDPRKPVQCFGKEASVKNKELVEGKEVRLEKDVSETDKYGRLLRYIYVGDTLINEQLVREGYATSYSYPPDIKYQDKFRAAEQEARANNRGLWGACPADTPVPTAKSTSTEGSGVCKYSCSSPDRDCPDFSTHAEAQAFFNCCGFTTTNDPMKLDSVGVGDGIACESLP